MNMIAATAFATVSPAVAAPADVALPGTSDFPKTFDPVAYIADIRALGTSIVPWPERQSFFVGGPNGLGKGYLAVCRKWAAARATDDDNVERTFLALMDEAAISEAPLCAP